jgi:hypothetical protein
MSMPKLPVFEGRTPDGMAVNVTGSVELEGPLQSPSKLEDTTYAVVQLTTTKVAHNVDKDGVLHRVETLKVEAIGIFDTTDEPAEIITRLHREARERAGISELPLS